MTSKKQINDWYFDNFERYIVGHVIDARTMIKDAMASLSAPEDERGVFETEAKWFLGLAYVSVTVG